MSSHWQFSTDSNAIGWLVFDQIASSTNTLSAETLQQLEQTLDSIEQAPINALVIKSAKANGFIAGADVRGFTDMHDYATIEHYILDVHKIFKRLEQLPVPSIALIHGFCLGGGLELALACNYRIAIEDDLPASTPCRIGFPEIRLGIFPGFGGTVRALRLLGVSTALPLILNARILNARQAKRIGLIDEAIPQRLLQTTLQSYTGRPHKFHRVKPLDRLLSLSFIRPLFYRYLQWQLKKKVNVTHYPAALLLLQHWRDFTHSPSLLYQNEASQVARLLSGDSAQNLIRVFLLQEKLKAYGKKAVADLRHVHVIGAGVMGGDIAAWCTLQGYFVTLQDQKPELLSRAMGRAGKLFERKLKSRHLRQAAIDRLMPDHKGFGLAKADVIIEAIFEDVDAKQQLFRNIEPLIKSDALLFSNTSSIPLESLSHDLQKPERLLGLHFFNPVAKMQLVEVIHYDLTDKKVLQQALAFSRSIAKLPLPVRSSPGFLVNRVLLPYMMEAIDCLQEGFTAEQIDAAAKAFGMPMGPIELADHVGLDICISVAEKLVDTLNISIPEVLRSMVSQGKLGKKTGNGFYRYKQDKIQPAAMPKSSMATQQELTDRLIFKLLNEAVACWREGIVDDRDAVDAGIIFGTGFAPFRGGPLTYIETQGKDLMYLRLQQLQKHYQKSFVADPGWQAQ